MEDDVVLSVRNVSKCFEMYEKPVHRLYQTFFAGHKRFYKEFWALRDISFDVHRGECVGIIGRNGAGKSTLLQIITGTLAPTTGEVKLKGRVAALLELGSGFNPEFTGRENVYLNGSILGLTKEEIDARYDEILAFADIGEFIDQPVKTYSSGMMVRLAFAVNAFVDPEILIVDEALAVGDISFQTKCFRRIQELRDRNVTILFVSHDLGSIVKYCSRAFILDRGCQIAAGKPYDIVNEFKMMMAEKASSLADTESSRPNRNADAQDYLPQEPTTSEYGDRKAVIRGFRLLDAKGNLTKSLLEDAEYRLQIDLHAAERIEAPIVAFTIRDTSNIELCGTNTSLAGLNIPPWEAGSDHQVEFSFRPMLQTRGYYLLLGCTEYVDGGLAVHHRLYDVCTLSVENRGCFVGLFHLPVTVSYRKR